MLVATDIASRGIDVADVSHVVNFDLPNSYEDYVHRIGRTARAGATGCAISLISEPDRDLWRDVERMTKTPIPQQVVEGFEPTPGRARASGDGGRRGARPRGSVPGRGNRGGSSVRRFGRPVSA